MLPSWEPREGALGALGPGPDPSGSPWKRRDPSWNKPRDQQPTREPRIPAAPSPRAASISNSSGIYLGAAALPRIRDLGSFPEGRARLPRVIPAGKAAHPGGEAALPAEFQWGKRRFWQNSNGESAPGRIPDSIPGRIPGWSSRAGLVPAAAALKSLDPNPGCGKGQFPASSLNSSRREKGEFHGAGI